MQSQCVADSCCQHLHVSRCDHSSQHSSVEVECTSIYLKFKVPPPSGPLGLVFMEFWWGDFKKSLTLDAQNDPRRPSPSSKSRGLRPRNEEELVERRQKRTRFFKPSGVGGFCFRHEGGGLSPVHRSLGACDLLATATASGTTGPEGTRDTPREWEKGLFLVKRSLEELPCYEHLHHSSYTTHHTSLIIHHSSYTIHHTPLIIHHSSYTTHHTPLLIHHSSDTTHHPVSSSFKSSSSS